MAKMSIIFDGFADLAEQIDRIGGNMQKAVNEALEATQEVVENNLVPAASVYATKGRKGYATGSMFKSLIRSTKVTWKGTVAEVNVGFNLGENFHSIFIMYGTPRIAKDTEIYNAIKGAKTKQEIEQVQAMIMKKYLSIGGDGNG